MIGVLSLLLPAALAAYFLYQAARRPIFLLGIPFMQFMAQSIFFRDLRPFRMPVALGTNGVILMWMALAWAWCVVRSRAEARSSQPLPRRRPAHLLPEEYPLVALAVLVLAKLLWGGIVSADTQALLGQFAPWGLLLAGYCLLRGAVRRSSSQDVAAFLLAVAVATTIASMLFILDQGLGVPIYHVQAYQVITFQGQTLTRTYWFMSPFLLVALAVGAALATGRAKGPWRAGAIVVVAVCLVAVMVSYTRNYVLAAAAVIVVLVALHSLKERRLDVLVRRSLTIAAVLTIAVVFMVLVMPGPTNYLLHRMASLTRVSTAVKDQNVLVRQADLNTVGRIVYEHYPLVGAPFGVLDDMSRKVSIWIPDSTWVGVLYWTGFVGVALGSATFILFGVRAFRLFLSASGSTEFLGAVYLAGIVAMFVNGLSGWSFLDESAYAMGFWLFAFVAGETIKSTELGLGALQDVGRGVEEGAGLGRYSRRPS